MELRHLRYFVAVAEELSFSRAAERLYIAQPPLSQQIQQLEKEIGVTLFDRAKRHIQLTDAGHAFLREAQAILARVEAAVETARKTDRGEMGWLRIGFAGVAAYEVLPAILRVFRQQYPHVELQLNELTEAEQQQALYDERIHVGLMRSLTAEDTLPGLASQSFSQQPLVVALPSSHPLAALDHIPLASLAQEGFIGPILHRQSHFWQQLVALCEDAGFRPRVAQEAREVQTAIALVAADMGIALVAASVQNLCLSHVVYRSIEGMTTGVQLRLVYRQEEHSPVLQVFLAVAREVAQQTSPVSP
jgi:DNA-binding transcriptional LysR family regulator